MAFPNIKTKNIEGKYQFLLKLLRSATRFATTENVWIKAAFFDSSVSGGFYDVKNWLYICFKGNSKLLNWLIIK